MAENTTTESDQQDDFSMYGSPPLASKAAPKTESSSDQIYPDATAGRLRSTTESTANGKLIHESSKAIQNLPKGIVIIAVIWLLSSVLSLGSTYDAIYFVKDIISIVMALGLLIRSRVVLNVVTVWLIVGLVASIVGIHLVDAKIHQQQTSDAMYASEAATYSDAPSGIAPKLSDKRLRDLKSAKDYLVMSSFVDAIIIIYLLRPGIREYFE